jgi:twitching motility protein PilT
MNSAITEPVYPVAGRLISARDLLDHFTVQRWMSGGISRYSDLHLKVGCPASYRCNGEIVPLEGAEPLTPEVAEKLILPFLGEKQVEQLRRSPPSDVDTAWYWTEKETNFRLNVFHDLQGLAAVMRVLPNAVPDVSQLGIPDELIWQDICQLHQGFVLVSGPTGSGKSTTIAAILNHVNRTRQARIITLEAPIEYLFTSDKSVFSQREVGRHVPTFADGLRSALREDPDIIYVGEMRDPESVSLALTAAETGHLVLSTIHTRDTRSAITRIIDVMPADRTAETASQLALSLTYVLGQKLLSRTGGGRVLAMEVLKNNSAIAHLIRKGEIHQIQTVLETGKKEGMGSFDKHLRDLVKGGAISQDEALQNAVHPKSFH